MRQILTADAVRNGGSRKRFFLFVRFQLLCSTQLPERASTFQNNLSAGNTPRRVTVKIFFREALKKAEDAKLGTLVSAIGSEGSLDIYGVVVLSTALAGNLPRGP